MDRILELQLERDGLKLDLTAAQRTDSGAGLDAPLPSHHQLPGQCAAPGRAGVHNDVVENFLRLERNIEANAAKGITAVWAAVSGDGQPVIIGGNPKTNSGGFSAFASDMTYRAGVSSVTLEGIFAEHHIERCKLLKIDCEGAEYGILTAGEAMLDRVDWLRGEFHTNKYLTEQGWTVEKLAHLCARHLKPGQGRVTPCRMGD